MIRYGINRYEIRNLWNQIMLSYHYFKTKNMYSSLRYIFEIASPSTVKDTRKCQQISGFKILFKQIIGQESLDSSVGRAGDCRGIVQTSLGHWFESGSRDIFIYINNESKSFFVPFIQKWVNYQQYGPIFLFLVK